MNMKYSGTTALLISRVQPLMSKINLTFLSHVFLCSKGESYKLFWPEQPEFVRMAVRFGVTIVPFGVVGVDDIVEVSLLCFT